MAEQLDGPIELYLETNRPRVFVGDSWTYDAVVYDGLKTGGNEYGGTVDISSGTVTGHLLVKAPSGGADYELAAGSTVDTQTSGYVDTFRFTTAASVTTTWTATLPWFSVEYRDSTGTVVRTIQVGYLDIRPKTSSAA